MLRCSGAGLQPCSTSIHSHPCITHRDVSKTWPGYVGKLSAKDVFSTKRAASSSEAGILKATASECASLVPVLGNFLARVVAATSSAELKEHAACMLLLVDVINMIQYSSRHTINCRQLRDTIDKYLTEYRRLYGANCMTPKFHSVLHYPTFLQRWGHIPNCWALERKHKSPKQYANSVKNTSCDWEGNLSREVTCRHLTALQYGNHFQNRPSLIEGHPASRNVAAALAQALHCSDDIHVSRSARISKWEKVHVGDVA
jgi:hypothetical protein